MNPLLNRLRYHVTGAIERGEATAIVEIPAQTRQLLPMDSLAVGTPVRCGNRAGYVHKCEQVRDQHGNPIMLHTINFVYRAKRGVAGRIKWEAMTPKVEAVNYAGISY